MEKINDALIDGIKVLLTLIALLLAGLKGWDIWVKGEVRKKQIDSELNIFGKEALKKLGEEIEELKKEKTSNKEWREKIESIIRKMEGIYEYMERRMKGHE